MTAVLFFCSQPESSDEVIPVVVITDLYTPGQDPGYVAVTQLNYMFDRDVPCGCAPFAAMKSEDDAMWDAPAFDTKGLDLLFEVQKGSSLILQAARTILRIVPA